MTIYSDVQGQVCRAWCQMHGTGTPGIRDHYNCSSVTDNATGRYTINFATSVGTSNFAAFITSSYGPSELGGSNDDDYINGIGTLRREASSTHANHVKIVCGHNFGTNCQDHSQICVAVFC